MHTIYNLPSINRCVCWGSEGRELPIKIIFLNKYPHKSTSWPVQDIVCDSTHTSTLKHNHVRFPVPPFPWGGGRWRATLPVFYYRIWLQVALFIQTRVTYSKDQTVSGKAQVSGEGKGVRNGAHAHGHAHKALTRDTAPTQFSRSHSNTPHQRLRLGLSNSGNSPESMESQKAAPAPIIVCLSLTNLNHSFLV